MIRPVAHEYAYQHNANADGVGGETVYWHPAIVMADGKAELTFDLPNSSTRYQVLVFSNTFDGRLGANRVSFRQIRAVRP